MGEHRLQLAVQRFGHAQRAVGTCQRVPDARIGGRPHCLRLPHQVRTQSRYFAFGPGQNIAPRRRHLAFEIAPRAAQLLHQGSPCAADFLAGSLHRGRRRPLQPDRAHREPYQHHLQ